MDYKRVQLEGMRGMTNTADPSDKSLMIKRSDSQPFRIANECRDFLPSRSNVVPCRGSMSERAHQDCSSLVSLLI